ncbi:MAG: hypothetical protein N5P05_004125 (plasmid) [Chroococcopsis gigantea SAG 12.99]|jgi:hypothetical protein|nr:hypothetical protein [Chroococcopsis gigantea SAG 12.99]
MLITGFEFPLAKANYLLNRATESGVGGDKRKFWREVMGFEDPEAIRAAILATVSLEMLQLQDITEYGSRYRAYLVELFGNWVKYDEGGNFISASSDEGGAFMETIGVEIVRPHQLALTVRARDTMGVREHLETVLDSLPEEKLAEVRDFAESLQQKQ